MRPRQLRRRWFAPGVDGWPTLRAERMQREKVEQKLRRIADSAAKKIGTRSAGGKENSILKRLQ